MSFKVTIVQTFMIEKLNSVLIFKPVTHLMVTAKYHFIHKVNIAIFPHLKGSWPKLKIWLPKAYL